MATKPSSMTEEQWAKHRADSKREHDAKAAVEASPSATLLDHEARIAALEGKKPAAEKPAAKKARK